VLAEIEKGVKCEEDEEIGEIENNKKKKRKIKEIKKEITCRK
jgi:hypothetical protein